MRSNEPIRILVAHEDPLVAAGLVATLGRHSDFAVSEHPREDGADIVVADYRRGCGLAAGATDTATRPTRAAPKVVIVTCHDREWEIRTAVEAGIHGYLLIGCAIEEVVEGMRAAARGMRYLCRAVAHRVADSLVQERLTGRETEVLHLIVAGHCNKTIATRLAISLGTVKAHVRAVLEKLDAGSRTHAAAVAAQRGLVSERPQTSGAMA